MNKSESIKNLAIALCKAQGDMEKASKNSPNPHFKSKYANLTEVLDCVKESFTPNGLCFTQMPSYENGVVYVETLVIHESGEWLSSVSGSPICKLTPQGVGDAITYLRRYSIAAIAGLGQEDTDGNSSEPTQPVATTQSQDDNKPWYGDNDYARDLQGMTSAIRGGTPADQVISEITQSYKMSNKYRNQIKSI